MNVLILGSGGREHAFAWKISQSSSCNNLFIAPGNAGTSSVGNNVEISPNDFDEIKKFVLKENIDIVVVGPEDPLSLGFSDAFWKKGIPVVGPLQLLAQIETSKGFTRDLLYKNKILVSPKYQRFEFYMILYQWTCL